LNVEPAWIQGYSGCNVTVAVVDDGNLEKLLVICTHCDNDYYPFVGLDISHDDLFDNVVSDHYRSS
jgi:hypothetical protein